MRRARVSALTAGLLVLAGFPFLRVASRAWHAAPGDLDLSEAWSWSSVVVAAVATSAAVFYWCVQRDRDSRALAVHETFEYHDAMLQKVVTARMALELDENDRAGLVLDGVIESVGDVITSFAEPGTGTDRRIPASTRPS
jgi:hypothetical protein